MLAYQEPLLRVLRSGPRTAIEKDEECKGGAAIEQISINLGHANIQTTERYLGVNLDLQNAPSDCIDLSVE